MAGAAGEDVKAADLSPEIIALLALEYHRDSSGETPPTIFGRTVSGAEIAEAGLHVFTPSSASEGPSPRLTGDGYYNQFGDGARVFLGRKPAMAQMTTNS